MSWCYRIVKHPSGHYALHEAYGTVNRQGRLVPDSWTDAPVDFRGDTPQEVRIALAQALRDALVYPVLDPAQGPRRGGPSA